MFMSSLDNSKNKRKLRLLIKLAHSREKQKRLQFQVNYLSV